MASRFTGNGPAIAEARRASMSCSPLANASSIVSRAAVQRDAPVGKQLDRRGQWAGDGEQRGGHRRTAQCGGPLVLDPKAQDRRVLGQRSGVCRMGRTVVARRNAGALQAAPSHCRQVCPDRAGGHSGAPAIRQTSRLISRDHAPDAPDMLKCTGAGGRVRDDRDARLQAHSIAPSVGGAQVCASPSPGPSPIAR